jgi:hypothetical protein
MFTRSGVLHGLSIFLAAGLFAFMLAPSAHAGAWNQRTVITSNGPVAIPGRVLPAGSYAFKLANPSSGDQVVEVTNANTGKFIAFLFATPTYRWTPTGKPVVTLEEQPSTAPPAIHKWFYPGDTIGQEFTYPYVRAGEESMGALKTKTNTAKG